MFGWKKRKVENSQITDKGESRRLEYDKELTLGQKLDFICQEKQGRYEIIEGRKVRFHREDGSVLVGSKDTVYDSVIHLMDQLGMSHE